MNRRTTVHKTLHRKQKIEQHVIQTKKCGRIRNFKVLKYHGACW